MLPKVGAAITQFISPIVSAREKQPTQERREQEQREQKQREKPEPEGFRKFQKNEAAVHEGDAGAVIKLVPRQEPHPEPREAPRDSQEEPESVTTEIPADVTPPIPGAATQTVLQLFNLLRWSGPLGRWLGLTAYKDGIRKRKNTSARKGAMFDRKVE